MYTQHLYDSNHLDDSNRFQDAEGPNKRTWGEFYTGVKQYEEKKTIPYTIEGIYTPFTITLYTNNKEIFDEFKKAKKQKIMLDLEYRYRDNYFRMSIPYTSFAHHLWYGRMKGYKSADIKINNINNMYHGKIRDIDFTKKTNQTPKNSKKIRLELYKNKTLFYTIEVNANPEEVKKFLTYREKENPTDDKMVYFMYASYHLIFKTYYLKPYDGSL